MDPLRTFKSVAKEQLKEINVTPSLRNRTLHRLRDERRSSSRSRVRQRKWWAAAIGFIVLVIAVWGAGGSGVSDFVGGPTPTQMGPPPAENAPLDAAPLTPFSVPDDRTAPPDPTYGTEGGPESAGGHDGQNATSPYGADDGFGLFSVPADGAPPLSPAACADDPEEQGSAERQDSAADETIHDADDCTEEQDEAKRIDKPECQQEANETEGDREHDPDYTTENMDACKEKQ